jgi:hypothetical protein
MKDVVVFIGVKCLGKNVWEEKKRERIFPSEIQIDNLFRRVNLFSDDFQLRTVAFLRVC